MPEDNMQDPEVRDDETVVPPVPSEDENAPEGAEAPKEDEEEVGDMA